MNKLFEEFIYEVMNRSQEEWGINIKSQKGKRLLSNDNNKKRNTFVDIMIEKPNEKIVLDTKYKKFKTSDDFSNADVFQVSTYCILHEAKHAILLYPQWDKDIKPNIQEYYLNNGKNDYKIEFKTVNLKYDNLKNHMEDIKTELEKIIKSCS
jgi:5-methylcytosine-specific restriction endonuclease McrBC regulatory subunit McrC